MWLIKQGYKKNLADIYRSPKRYIKKSEEYIQLCTTV
jgi:hypothetical protein